MESLCRGSIVLKLYPKSWESLAFDQCTSEMDKMFYDAENRFCEKKVNLINASSWNSSFNFVSEKSWSCRWYYSQQENKVASYIPNFAPKFQKIRLTWSSQVWEEAEMVRVGTIGNHLLFLREDTPTPSSQCLWRLLSTQPTCSQHQGSWFISICRGKLVLNPDLNKEF